MRLGELISPAKVSRCGDRELPILSITKQDGIVLQSEKFKKKVASADVSGYKVVPRGKLVQGIHIDEANFGIQDLVDEGIVSPAYKIWDVNEKLVLPEYLAAALRSECCIAYYRKNLSGTVHRRGRMSNEVFDAMEINVPSLDEQLMSMRTLDEVLAEQKAFYAQLNMLDELVKSRFVEMFGDGDIPYVRLGDYCTRITKGTTPTTAGFEFVEAGINFIKVESIDDQGGFIGSKIDHIDDPCHQALKRSQLEEGDVLFSIAGAIGRIAVVTEDVLPANTNQALAIIRLADSAPFNRIFLKHALSASSVITVAEKLKRGVAQVNLSLKDVGNFMVPLPDCEQQQKFATFVQQVDKLKFVIGKSIEKLQMLYDSLAQEYFGQR